MGAKFKILWICLQFMERNYITYYPFQYHIKIYFKRFDYLFITML